MNKPIQYKLVGLTDTEKAMLARLKSAGSIYWVDICGNEVRTLNRLVKKGCAKECFGRLGRRTWEPLTPNVQLEVPTTEGSELASAACKRSLRSDGSATGGED